MRKKLLNVWPRKLFKQFIVLFDIDSILPRDYGMLSHREYPVFFKIESFLILPSGLFILASFVISLFALAEFLGLVVPLQGSHDIWTTITGSFLTGIAGFSFIRLLAHLQINNEQYQWMLSSYKKLGLEKPHQKMNKQNLKEYVEKLYFLESERPPIL